MVNNVNQDGNIKDKFMKHAF